MKLNWFSPLSPAKTDIANYTLRVLAELSKHAQILLWTDQTHWDRKIEEYTQVKSFRSNIFSWSEINQADLNIYHIGNNPLFHSNIWEISSKSPGIVILHDFKLYNFFGEIYKEQSHDEYSYLNKLLNVRYHKYKQVIADFSVGKLSSEYMAEHYSLNDLATEGAIGVITHNKEIYQILSQENRFLTGYIPLPYISDIALHIKQKKFNHHKPYRLIVFV